MFLKHELRLQETRTLSNDWVVRYHNRLLQLERPSARMPARSTVQVCEARDGTLIIRYRDLLVPWRELVPGHASTRTPSTTVPPPSVSPPPRVRGRARGLIIRGAKASARGAAAVPICGRPSAIERGHGSFTEGTFLSNQLWGTFLTSFDTIPLRH